LLKDGPWVKSHRLKLPTTTFEELSAISEPKEIALEIRHMFNKQDS